MVPVGTRLPISEGAVRTLLGTPDGALPGLDRLSFADGETILKEGEAPDGIYILERGSVVVERGRRDTTGTPLILHSASADGDEPVFFGEMAPLLGVSRTASVRASGPTIVLRLPAGAIRESFARAPLLAERLFRRMARLLRETTDQLESVQNLLQTAPRRIVARGPTVLYEAGAAADTLFQVIVGEATLSPPGGAPRAVPGSENPESFLNARAYFRGEANRERAVAATGAMVLAYDADRREAVVRRFPDLALAVLRDGP